MAPGHKASREFWLTQVTGKGLPPMTFASFELSESSLVIATAVHNGHEIRPDLRQLLLLDDAVRLREEDPFTGVLASGFLSNVVVHRSRFEVDLNRERNGAVYRVPDDAWGLEIWSDPLPQPLVDESRRLYDGFYAELGGILDQLIATNGGFVLYDIHSYNHRRGGPEAPPEPQLDNPVVNLGTGSLPPRWRPVAEEFTAALSAAEVDGSPLDVRENIRFEGRQVAAWVHERYGAFGCALAIEIKKVFMDEWTGELYPDRLAELDRALQTTVSPVAKAWAGV